MRAFSTLVAALLVVVIVACGDETKAQSFPEQHRADPTACPARAPGMTSDAGFGACSSDADCTQGTNGRCGLTGGKGSLACSYDACVSDADCAANTACSCRATQGNACVAANCRSDADCAGRGCSPTFDTTCGAFDGVTGFYCHTPSDACVDDSDCIEGGLNGYCAFQLQVGHWACAYGHCAG